MLWFGAKVVDKSSCGYVGLISEYSGKAKNFFHTNIDIMCNIGKNILEKSTCKNALC